VVLALGAILVLVVLVVVVLVVVLALLRAIGLGCDRREGLGERVGQVPKTSVGS
jgi:hypothetical protein